MKENISKFAPGAFIILLGISMLGFGLKEDQNSHFIVAAISIAIAGLITILNAVGKINNKISLGVAGVLMLLSVYLIVENYNSIDEPIQFKKEKQRRYSAVIQSLKDLRQIELTYKKENNAFCANMDTLMDFLANDSVTIIVKDGNLPDSLVGQEALAIEMGIITRDTVPTPAMDIAFDADYMKTRDKRYPLDIANLRYIPHTENVEFDIDAGEIVRSSGAKVKVFEISDAAPFDKNDVMRVGSMSDPTTSGNWKEEK